MSGEKVQLVNHAVSDNPMGITCLRVKKGALTEAHCHETECLLVVVEGAWRVHLRDRAVTVRTNEMLHIPPRHEHYAEALTDTVALRISSRDAEGTVPADTDVPREDSDQYLWGV